MNNFTERLEGQADKAAANAHKAAESLFLQPLQIPEMRLPVSSSERQVEGIPQSIDELNYTDALTYDLSVTAAADLKIPVLGGISGGINRRVVVYEHAQYKPIIEPDDGSELRYGLAVRFCVTINKLDASLNISVPFLAAQAQLGQIEARWIMQIRGLSGQALTSLILAPQDLNVETFMLAKQHMEDLIGAIYDPGTVFSPGVIIARIQKMPTDQLTESVLETFALAAIANRRPLSKVLRTRAFPDDQQAILAGVYSALGVSNSEHPTESAEASAERLLNGLFKI